MKFTNINISIGEAKLKGTFGNSTLFNPSVYKDDFNHMPMEKPKGMMPTTTDARILPSQAYYSSMPRERRINRKHKEKPKAELDDTFARFESDLKEKNDENLQKDATNFYLLTPVGGQPAAQPQNLSKPEPAVVQPVRMEPPVAAPEVPSTEAVPSEPKYSAPSVGHNENKSIPDMYSGKYKFLNFSNPYR